jgi:hypothetical protein
MSIEDAQAALLGTALGACEGREPRYGKYKFETTERLTSQGATEPEAFMFAQEVECVDGSDAPRAIRRTEISEADRQKAGTLVHSMSSQYFAQLEAGDFAASYAMLSENMQSMSPLDSWIAENREFHNKAGRKIDGGVFRITVYVDPPDSPGPGIYIAADYEIRYEHVPFRCGYIVWFQGADSAYRLIRQESGYLDDETSSKLTKAQVQEIRTQYGCIAP